MYIQKIYYVYTYKCCDLIYPKERIQNNCFYQTKLDFEILEEFVKEDERKLYKAEYELDCMQEMITISKDEYKELKIKAEIDESLLIKLVKGLEDIKAGRIKPWKKVS